MLDINAVRNWDFGVLSSSYTERDTMLYALALGFGDGQLESDELDFVFEKRLRVVPTMAGILCSPGPWYGDARTGIDVSKVVHGEQDITFFSPLAPAASLTATASVTAVVDKGPGKGAIIEIQRELFGEDGKRHARIRHVAFCRGEGGCSLGPPSIGQIQPLPAVPARSPDRVVALRTLPQSALLYRLLGDYNPLHADPAYAKMAGFDRPILHGLCGYGMAVRAGLSSLCDGNPQRLRRIAARFSAPVFPGETLHIELWYVDDDTAQFQARVVERGVIALANGRFELGPNNHA